VAPDVVAAAGGVDAIARRCGVLRELALPGAWRVLDLTSGPEGVALETDAPVGPSLADLLGSAVVEPIGAAHVLNDVGQTLRTLARGRVRGTEPRPDSIVVGETGVARLRDVAVRPVDGDGAAAWADLVTEVGRAWGGEFADAFGAVADVARSSGLDGGLAALGELARHLPKGEDERASLRPAPRAGATVLGRRGRPAERPRRSLPVADDIRFGPGVPTTSAGTAAQPPLTAPAARTPAARRHWLVRALLLILVATATALLWWWLHRPGTLSVGGMTAAPTASVGCDRPAALRVTLHTNGVAGEVRYRWRRSDGRVTAPMVERMADGQHSAVLVLNWRVVGSGTFHGSARVEEIAPRSAASPPASFDYRCG
jgi:hypothetical protein